jgi:aryl-alcohol dehydrogenase-like predicted oxidoreductase
MNQPFELMLGSAQWGWTTDRLQAFSMLDFWLKNNRRSLDLATNYPINRNPDDFRAAEKILAEYCQAHGISDLKITVKVGSQNNMRGPEINLAPSFIRMIGEEYLRVFGKNLDCVMLHWDNRVEESAIRSSLEALHSLETDFGLRAGLSGLAHPNIYAEALSDLPMRCDIQLKHNVIQSDLARYQPLLDKGHRFFGYGINAGGIKLDAHYGENSTFTVRGGQPEKVEAVLEHLRQQIPIWNVAFVRPPVKTMNHVGLIYASHTPVMNGIVVGASTVAQLAETLDYYRNLETFDYSDVWLGLKNG